jgi:hypothetical protein
LRRREFIFITALLTELGYETLGASARAEPLRKARPLGDLSGTWHALWQTTEQGIEKRNRETVAIRQRSDELEIRNAAISPDIRVGGYLWQGTMRWLPDNTLVGEYWSVDPAASAHGTLYYVVNASGQFMEGMWVGTNMDYALTTGCCVLARDEETADRCFGRLLQKDRQIYLKQTEV